MAVGKGKRDGPTFSCKGFISCSFLIAFLHTLFYLICTVLVQYVGISGDSFQTLLTSFAFFRFLSIHKMHRSHVPFPFTSKRSPNRGLGLLFLPYSDFLLVCFFFFSVFVFFTGSGLSSSLFKLICRSSFLKWAWLPIFSICPRFPLNQ